MYYSLYVPVVQLHVIHIYRQFVRNILIGTDHKMKWEGHDTATQKIVGDPLTFAEILQETYFSLLTILV